jgi:hypothetical protein
VEYSRFRWSIHAFSKKESDTSEYSIFDGSWGHVNSNRRHRSHVYSKIANIRYYMIFVPCKIEYQIRRFCAVGLRPIGSLLVCTHRVENHTHIFFIATMDTKPIIVARNTSHVVG